MANIDPLITNDTGSGDYSPERARKPKRKRSNPVERLEKFDRFVNLSYRTIKKGTEIVILAIPVVVVSYLGAAALGITIAGPRATLEDEAIEADEPVIDASVDTIATTIPDAQNPLLDLGPLAEPVPIIVVDETPVLEEPVANNDIPTTDISVEQVTAQESFFPIETLTEGNKIGDMVVKNPDGEEIINIPLIANLEPGPNSSTYNRQLERGAILEVRHPLVNPESPYNTRALPGLEGDAVIFGHRVTEIKPDRDGDGNSDDVSKQIVFRRINEIEVGAILTITSSDGSVIEYRLVDPVDQSGIQVEDLGSVDKLNSAASEVRSQNTDGRKMVKLVACHPPGSTKYRIIANFEEIPTQG